MCPVRVGRMWDTLRIPIFPGISQHYLGYLSPTEDVFRPYRQYDSLGTVETLTAKRTQRRRKAILPLKVLVNVADKIHLAHTLDISASGARVVLADRLAPRTAVTVENKHRRTRGIVVWCRPLHESKYDHEIGIRLENAGSTFWGINLPLNELDSPEDVAAIPFRQFASSLSNQP